MKDSFKNAHSKFYKNKNLTEDQLERLQATQKASYYFKLGFRAAAIALICISIFAINKFIQDKTTPLPQKIASEVIYNHIKGKPPEVLTASYSEATDALDKLPFKISETYTNSSKFKLIGARYCSIQSKIAVQIKLTDLNNNIYTLYQFKLNESLSSLPDHFMFTKNNVKVIIWKARDLGFALAESL